MELILGFWFEPETIAPESLSLALSNVYSEPDGEKYDDPLVIVSFAFRAKAAAMSTESTLSSKFSTSELHYLTRRDRVVVVGARKPRLSAACSDAVWRETVRCLDAAA